MLATQKTFFQGNAVQTRATNHMQQFTFKLTEIKLNCIFSSSVTLAMVQVLSNHTGSVAVKMNSRYFLTEAVFYSS